MSQLISVPQMAALVAATPLKGSAEAKWVEDGRLALRVHSPGGSYIDFATAQHMDLDTVDCELDQYAMLAALGSAEGPGTAPPPAAVEEPSLLDRVVAQIETNRGYPIGKAPPSGPGLSDVVAQLGL